MLSIPKDPDYYDPDRENTTQMYTKPGSGRQDMTQCFEGLGAMDGWTNSMSRGLVWESGEQRRCASSEPGMEGGKGSVTPKRNLNFCDLSEG